MSSKKKSAVKARKPSSPTECADCGTKNAGKTAFARSVEGDQVNETCPKCGLVHSHRED